MARGQLLASTHRTSLGVTWHLLMPIIQISIYYVLVVVIFNRGESGYFPMLSMGIFHYTIFQSMLADTAGSIYGHAGLLLQIKLEPLVLVASSFVKSLRTSTFGILIFLLLYFAMDPVVSLRLAAYPVILLSWLWCCWSTAIFVSAASVYSRDLVRLLPFIAQILMYMSPVIYGVTFFPERLYGLFLLNPIAVIFALFQWCLFSAPFPPIHVVLLLPVTLTLMFVGAHLFFTTCRKGFTKTL